MRVNLIWTVLLRLIGRSDQKAIGSEFLAAHKEKDPEINRKSMPPAGEIIDASCMWTMECYAPNDLDKLIASFEKLNWGPRFPSSANNDPKVWVSNARRRHVPTGSLNLGRITAVRSEGPLGLFERIAPLPKDVEYATGWAFSVSPSLVCIVIRWVYEESAALCFDKLLRRTFASELIAGEFSSAIENPAGRKSIRINQIRAKRCYEASSWFNMHLPGLFSAGVLGGEHPSCELITLQCADPLMSDDDVDSSRLLWGYESVLGMFGGFGDWREIESEAVKLRTDSRPNRSNPKYLLSAFANAPKIEEALEQKESSEKGRSAVLEDLDWRLADVIRLWGILMLLEGFTGRLNTLSARNVVQSGGRRSVLQGLEAIRKRVAFGVDISSVVDELSNENLQWLANHHGTGKFEPVYPQVFKESHALRDFLQGAIKKNATWLRTRESAVRHHSIQQASLLSSEESIRVQQKLNRLTWALIVLAFLTVLNAPWLSELTIVLREYFYSIGLI